MSESAVATSAVCCRSRGKVARSVAHSKACTSIYFGCPCLGDVAALNTGATLSTRNKGAQSELIAERARYAERAGCRWLIAETGQPALGPRIYRWTICCAPDLLVSALLVVKDRRLCQKLLT